MHSDVSTDILQASVIFLIQKTGHDLHVMVEVRAKI